MQPNGFPSGSTNIIKLTPKIHAAEDRKSKYRMERQKSGDVSNKPSNTPTADEENNKKKTKIPRLDPGYQIPRGTVEGRKDKSQEIKTDTRERRQSTDRRRSTDKASRTENYRDAERHRERSRGRPEEQKYHYEEGQVDRAKRDRPPSRSRYSPKKDPRS